MYVVLACFARNSNFKFKCDQSRPKAPEEICRFKTVRIETYTSLFGGKVLTDKKSLEFILGKNSLVPIVEIAFPRSVYLFHCSIQNNAGGDETTFAFAITHHQNSSQG
jgi:hypothetical protein